VFGPSAMRVMHLMSSDELRTAARLDGDIGTGVIFEFELSRAEMLLFGWVRGRPRSRARRSVSMETVVKGAAAETTHFVVMLWGAGSSVSFVPAHLQD
jgi:hypothetical protein